MPSLGNRILTVLSRITGHGRLLDGQNQEKMANVLCRVNRADPIFLAKTCYLLCKLILEKKSGFDSIATEKISFRQGII